MIIGSYGIESGDLWHSEDLGFGVLMGSDRCGSDVDELVRLVQEKCGMDFMKYRPACIGRRISYRMVMVGCRNMDEYIAYVNSHPAEIERLLDVVTIHKTGFFRDLDVFDALLKDVFPGIIEGKLTSGDKVIRVWSAGCSTGEETYSITIHLIRLLQTEKLDIRVEVFGTDISEESCRVAMRGVYPICKLQEVTRHIKRCYFEMNDEYCRVHPDVMRLVKFSVHDLFSKPPFSMLDLVVCRNVLIHFDQSVRNDVLSNFYSSLKNGGVLILGKSEAVTGSALKLYEAVNPRNRIYRKRILCE